MKLLFYNIFVCKNGEFTDYPLERLMDNLISLTSSQRYISLRSNAYKLNKVISDDDQHSRNREMWFSKYRDNRPYAGSRDTDEMNELDREILEPSLCLLIPDSFLLVMEYNYFGPSYKGLEDYMNNFLVRESLPNDYHRAEDENSDDIWAIKIIPVKTEDQMNIIRNSDFIKSISIDYKVEDFDYNNLLEGNYEQKPIIVEAIKKNAEVSKLMDSKIGTITLKKGRFRAPLNMNEALMLFSSLDVSNNVIRAVKVEIKENTGKSKVIDLKHNGKLSKDIRIDGSGFDYLRIRIRDEYYNVLHLPASREFIRFVPFENVDYINLTT